MFLITVDPSTKKSAFVVFHNNRILTHKKIVSSNYNDISRFFKEYSPFLLAIEYQFFSKNPKTLISLVETRSKIELLAILNGCKGIYKIKPVEWQKIISHKKLKRDEIKKYSLQISNNFLEKFGKTNIDEDISDSICIGIFVYNNFNKLECTI